MTIEKVFIICDGCGAEDDKNKKGWLCVHDDKTLLGEEGQVKHGRNRY